MTRHDLNWCLGGLMLGGLIALSTLQSEGYTGGSFEAGRLTGNVVGGVLAMFVIGRIVRRFSRKS
ncbi:MAG: hypothetical protein AB7F98_01945 [Novosphingobium sp.]